MVWEFDDHFMSCKLTGIKKMLDKVFTKVTNIKKIFLRVLLP